MKVFGLYVEEAVFPSISYTYVFHKATSQKIINFTKTYYVTRRV